MEEKEQVNKAYEARRFAMTVAGVLLCSFSIAVFKESNFGLDPFQCLSQGVYIPLERYLPFGIYYIIWSFLLLIGDFFLDKKQLGPATLVHMFLTGYIVDWSCRLIRWVLPSPALGTRIAMLVFAVVATCIGASLYFTSAQGVSVYDAIPLALAAKKIRLAGRIIPFRYIRVASDVICVIAGCLFGLYPGIGTIITAFFMGPLIEFFNVHIARPLLAAGTAVEGKTGL